MWFMHAINFKEHCTDFGGGRKQRTNNNDPTQARKKTAFDLWIFTSRLMIFRHKNSFVHDNFIYWLEKNKMYIVVVDDGGIWYSFRICGRNKEWNNAGERKKKKKKTIAELKLPSSIFSFSLSPNNYRLIRRPLLIILVHTSTIYINWFI